MVPLYSALNASASHPSILRAIFCDGAAFPRVDFLTNLLSFCVAVRNAGLSDHNLLTLLSASVAGSLYGGAGHSLVYEEPQVYSLAVRYLLEVTSPNSYPTTKASESATPPKLQLEPFSTLENAKWNSNPFALPWSLRGLLEDGVVRRYYDPIIEKLLRDYHDWNPTTKTLKDGEWPCEYLSGLNTSLTPHTTSFSAIPPRAHAPRHSSVTHALCVEIVRTSILAHLPFEFELLFVTDTHTTAFMLVCQHALSASRSMPFCLRRG